MLNSYHKTFQFPSHAQLSSTWKTGPFQAGSQGSVLVWRTHPSLMRFPCGSIYKVFATLAQCILVTIYLNHAGQLWKFTSILSTSKTNCFPLLTAYRSFNITSSKTKPHTHKKSPPKSRDQNQNQSNDGTMSEREIFIG